MKTTTIAAVVLCCATSAIAQLPAEKPVNENLMYTYRVTTPPAKDGVRTFDAPYTPTYKNVLPPFPEANVPMKTYPVNNQTGGMLVYESGTSLYIPGNAFVDENGEEVQGVVSVGYREFKKPVDFILSGIPMSYESDGNRNMFLSAGMFEMTASVNGSPVYLKEGERVNVEMASVDKKPDYNLYAFNGTSGEWEERESKQNIAVSETVLPTYSPAVRAYLQGLSFNRRIRSVDSTTCRQRFESERYFYTSRSNGALRFKKNRWRAKDRTYTALIKIRDVRQNNKDGSIVFRIEKAAPGTHSELGVYGRTAWKVDRKSYPELKKALSNKNGFFDVRIEKSSDLYTIRLKGANGFIDINAEPVKMSRKKKISDYTPRVKAGMYKIYSRVLRARERSFDKQIAKEMKRYKSVDTQAKREEKAWSSSKYIMAFDEREMPLEDWKVYVEQKKKEENTMTGAVGANSISIVRSFSIDGMGIWNCDQIYRLKDPVRIAARFTDKEGERMKALNTYVVDKALNGVLQYDKGDITFSPTSDNIFIIVREGGELAYTTTSELVEPVPFVKGSYTFRMNEVNSKITSVDALRDLMGM